MRNATATIKFTGHLSTKRFRDAKGIGEMLGGTYDPAEKAWTVALGEDYRGQQPQIFVEKDLRDLATAYGAEVVTA